ncbi:MAG: DUF1727 domain-containing protein [Synergistetes bacterium]|nr:DUF1727 domain-containing protein [Synergistota bacterium]
MNYLAILLGKALLLLSRELKKGHGSVLPGYIIEKLFPNFLKRFQKKHRLNIILVTGTNGKTTTTKLITNILRENNLSVICNPSGANLPRGIISSIAREYRLFGRNRWDYGVFEVDEGHLYEVCSMLSPSHIVFLNLFRDQLDRYGEIQKNFSAFKRALSIQGLQCKIIVNVDDPLINYLKAYQKSTGFGIEDPTIGTNELSDTADSKFCPICNTRLSYQKVFYAHMGKYWCKNCGYKRYEPEVQVEEIKEFHIDGSVFSIEAGESCMPINSKLPGLYNISNIAAAVALVISIGLRLQDTVKAVSNTTAAFGRGEKFIYKDKLFYIMLVKNPTGYNAVINLLKSKKDLNILLYLNDNIPDGTDVSWIWDVNFEELKNRVSILGISGTRGYDMEVRIKYSELNHRRGFTELDIEKALLKFINMAENKKNYILANYSAMTELRDKIKRKGILKRYEA